MSGKKERTRCVHCLREVGLSTLDHVFPKSWYPDSTPDNLQKWKAPACFDCNHRLGKIEEDLRMLLALGIDETDPDLKGIQDKVIRSVNPRLARSPNDRRRREKRLKSLLSQTERVNKPPTGLLPVRKIRFPLDGEIPVVQIPEQMLVAFCEKVVRGLEFALYDSYVSDDRSLVVHVVWEDTIEKVERGLMRAGKRHFRGSALEVVAAKTASNPPESLYKIIIWKHIYFYATIMDASAND